jgi:hypothetical protein
VENLEDMYNFLDEYDLLKLSKESINYLNISTASNEIETVIVTQPKKSPGPDGSQLN